MITPPFNEQGDRLVLPDLAVEKLAKLKESRATAAAELARKVVLQRLEPWFTNTRNLDGTPRARPDGVPQGAAFVDVAPLVDLILELVQVAVHADRARQREVLREVQASLPAWAALGQAAPPPPAGDPRPFAERADVERK